MIISIHISLNKNNKKKIRINPLTKKRDNNIKLTHFKNNWIC